MGTGNGAYAFLYSNGTIQDLNSLLVGFPSGDQLEYAYGINDAGQIVGQASWGAFLLTPFPSPRPSPGSSAPARLRQGSASGHG